MDDATVIGRARLREEDTPNLGSARRRLRAAWRRLALPVLLLAVLLQADAVVQSTVMRLVGMDAMAMGEGAPAAPPMCSGVMAPMAMQAPARQDRKSGPGHGDRVCSYCAAAAHAPTLALAAPVRPSCAVGFAAFLQTAVHGPRGPPGVSPRARGPPLSA